MLFDIGLPPKFAKLSEILWKIWKFWKRTSADQIHCGGESYPFVENFLFFKINFFLFHKEFPCWNWYLRNVFLFLCEPGSARFADSEENTEFFSQVVSRNHSIIFFSANLALGRVPGLGQITWRIVLTKQIVEPLGKKIARKSRISRRARDGEVGAEGMVTKGANWRSPEIKYKRSKNAFAVTSITLTLVPLGNKLLELPVQSLIGSPGTLTAGSFYEPWHCRFVLRTSCVYIYIYIYIHIYIYIYIYIEQ